MHPRAYVAGDVILGEGANIWCGACIRGDIAPVVIGKNTNIQDNVSVHVGYGAPVTIGEGVTVGHNAVIHGCTIDDNVLIGMGAIVMDGASSCGRESLQNRTGFDRCGKRRHYAKCTRVFAPCANVC